MLVILNCNGSTIPSTFEQRQINYIKRPKALFQNYIHLNTSRLNRIESCTTQFGIKICTAIWPFVAFPVANNETK